MYPILFHLGKVNFYTHGLMIALGAIVGGVIIFYLAKKEGLSRKFLFDTLIYSLFVGIIFARITYIIFYYYQFVNWKEMFLIWYGGLVSFGGILGGFLAAGLILKKRGEIVLKWFDLGIIGFLAGWAIGKVGCLFSLDTPGIASGAKIAIWGQIPVALFESIWAAMLAILLFYLIVRQRSWVSQFRDGFLFLIGLGGYSLGRFGIDFWRTDSILWLSLKSGQIASLVILLITIALTYFYVLVWRKGRRASKGVYDAGI